jgi:hypothetical protein
LVRYFAAAIRTADATAGMTVAWKTSEGLV